MIFYPLSQLLVLLKYLIKSWRNIVRINLATSHIDYVLILMIFICVEISNYIVKNFCYDIPTQSNDILYIGKFEYCYLTQYTNFTINLLQIFCISIWIILLVRVLMNITNKILKLK